MLDSSATSTTPATEASARNSLRSRLPVAVSYLISCGLILNAIYIAFTPMFVSSPAFGDHTWMLFLEDDFFYYLKVAQNIAAGHGSTWNGLVLTNGYHPLWLALLSLETALFPSAKSLQIFLSLAIVLSTFLTYLLSRRLLRTHSSQLALTSALAAYVAIYSQHILTGGMEVILTVPLFLAVVVVYQDERRWVPSMPRGVGVGLLLSALCLSRIDTILFVTLLGAVTLLLPALRRRLSPPLLWGVLIGLIPVLLYVLSNQVFFHTWLPISGMAKQLKADHLPSAPAWHSLFGKSPKSLLNVFFIFCAIAVFPFIRRRLSPAEQALFPVVLLFPFIYIFTLSCVSDWALWEWYFYCLRAPLCLSFVVFLVCKPSKQLLGYSGVAALVTLFVMVQIAFNRRAVATAGGAGELLPAQDIRAFANNHPGIYAMGDSSGMVGYLVDQPIVQTEGLMMDRGFLRLMAANTPLREALAYYHVRYYVATELAKVPYKPCFQAHEPFEAGPRSARMRDTFCEAPVADWTYGDYRKLIFDLHPEQNLPGR